MYVVFFSAAKLKKLEKVEFHKKALSISIDIVYSYMDRAFRRSHVVCLYLHLQFYWSSISFFSHHTPHEVTCLHVFTNLKVQ